MTGKERIDNIFSGKAIDRNAFWMGIPHKDSRAKFYKHFGVDNDMDLGIAIGNDMCPLIIGADAWKHPDGQTLFGLVPWDERHSLSQDGYFAQCDSVSAVERFPWPDPKFLDFSETITNAKKAHENGQTVFSGLWTCFFHDLCDLFGMENYFVKMHTDPDVVEAVTEHVMDYYLEGNRRCFEEMGGLIDVFFFGNDLGSQLDLLISPGYFDKFVLPHTKKAVELAKKYGYKVMLHSCGAVRKLIPKFIEIGIDALHPIQAKAAGMDAASLSREYKNDLVFVGGVDTQELLPFGAPEQVKEEVARLVSLFGDRLVVSPSHEAVLPVVSVENMIAMRDAAIK